MWLASTSQYWSCQKLWLFLTVYEYVNCACSGTSKYKSPYQRSQASGMFCYTIVANYYNYVILYWWQFCAQCALDLCGYWRGILFSFQCRQQILFGLLDLFIYYLSCTWSEYTWKNENKTIWISLKLINHYWQGWFASVAQGEKNCSYMIVNLPCSVFFVI